ncbi:Zinc finger protein 728 [Amphibalanus amphitrite]|uniref:Zinc finger protein 728 n=1 Tax=Amphibalanus amphitrite TaxID=1232801 RepID=A0A6A4WRL0_AMPAM|nr:Zinc finger protein 728 [Amphibalanus amphitrite]
MGINLLLGRHDRSPFGSDVLLPGTGQGLRRRPHGVDTPFGCPHCPAAYSNRGSLVNHMSIHSGRTVCEACGKVFSTVSSRNRHINKHHQEAEPAGGEQPPPAPLPGTALPTMASVSGMALQTMAARHSSPALFPQLPRTTSLFPVPAGDAFPCRLCGRVYRSSSSRSAHERVHSGTTSCHICGRFLGKMGNLKRHLVNRHRMESGDAAELLRQRAAAPGAGRLTAGQATDPDSALERLMNQL